MPQYISRKIFQAMVGKCERTTYRWQKLGVGPEPHFIGGRTMYRMEAVEKFLAESKIKRAQS